MEKLLDNSYYNDLYQVALSTDEEKDYDSDIDEAELLIKQPKDKDKFKRQRIPYPKSVFFIIGNEFCERFSFYGMVAVLSLYLKNKLEFSEDRSTVIYHAFSGLSYATPIFGALLADQYFGKYKTIFWISIIYILGQALVTTAAIPMFNEIGLDQVLFSMIGLFLIAVGTGGIKPCVSAFGGDQFKLPQQQSQLQTFFSMFYLSVNGGSLISTFFTPIFRKDIHCFGDDTCYSLAFGVPAILMAISTIILVIGNHSFGGYVHEPPQGSIVSQVLGSIWYAKKQPKNPGEIHWLDRAKGIYREDLIEDTKILLKMLALYLPLPVFWALLKQQGSRWTFQATRMNGQIGNNYIIKPDQMQLLNPGFIVILIPLFDQIIYPYLSKFNLLKKPLQRIVTGGVLTGSAFFISGFLQLALVKTNEKVPAIGESQYHIMNLLSCDVSVKIFDNESYENNFELLAKMNNIVNDLSVGGMYTIKVNTNENCSMQTKSEASYELSTNNQKVTGILIRSYNNDLNVISMKEYENPEKDIDPKIKFVFNTGNNTISTYEEIFLKSSSQEIKVIANISYNGIIVSPYNQNTKDHYVKIDPGTYDIFWKGEKINEQQVNVHQGSVHTFVIDNSEKINFMDFILTKENSIHMLWIVPQYFVITVGEILFSITCNEFSYSQAPASMKSFLQSINLLTVAFGDFLVIVVAEVNLFDQVSEFFMFGCLMLVDMALFAYLASTYTYVETQTEKLVKMK